MEAAELKNWLNLRSQQAVNITAGGREHRALLHGTCSQHPGSRKQTLSTLQEEPLTSLTSVGTREQQREGKWLAPHFCLKPPTVGELDDPNSCPKLWQQVTRNRLLFC